MTTANEPDGRGEMWIATAELSDMARAHAARALGLELPVSGEVLWGWSPGVGPVARVRIEHVPNVVQLKRIDRR